MQYKVYCMQKKVGIRLRHLQGPSELRQQQLMSQLTAQPRNRQRSQSPLSRRKIFPQNYSQAQYNAEPQPEPPVQHQPKTYQIRYNTETSARPYTSTMTSPIMNHPLNNNSISMSDNVEYQSEVERLIESLKKKTVELQKKQEIISKLNLEIDMLRTQNGQYMAQIKLLRAQIQAQKMQRLSQINSSRSNISQKKYSPASSQSFPSRQPPTSRISSPVYQNQPYQELTPLRKDPVIHVKLNPAKITNIAQQQVKKQQAQPQSQSQSYNRRNHTESEYQRQPEYEHEYEERNKKRRNQDYDRNREQDSVLSDYLSPLMVLNNKETMTQSASHTYSRDYNNKNKNDDDSRFDLKKKASTRIQYTQKYQPDNNNTMNKTNNVNNQSQRVPDNPFARKPPQTYQQQQPLQFNPPPLSQTFGRDLQYHRHPQPKYSTLQSSAAHFNMNVKQSFPPSFPTFSKNMESRKQLAIQDSKQFKFEDFDFSELDNSVANSQF